MAYMKKVIFSAILLNSSDKWICENNTIIKMTFDMIKLIHDVCLLY